MPLYNVEVSVRCTMVVQADDAEHAFDVARNDWREGVSDSDASPTVIVTGDVRSEAHLREGWDGMCLPYGGDGNTRIKDLLAHNAKLKGEASLSSDGLERD